MIFLFRNKIPSKKNNRNVGYKKNTPSYSYIKWSEKIKKNINNIVFFNEKENNNLFYFKNKKNLVFKAIFLPFDRKRFDLTNVVQSIEDTLSDLEIIQDDKFEILSHFRYSVDLNYFKEDIFCIVEISEDINKINDFKEIYNVLNKKEYLNFPKFDLGVKHTTKKQKKKKVYFEGFDNEE